MLPAKYRTDVAALLHVLTNGHAAFSRASHFRHSPGAQHSHASPRPCCLGTGALDQLLCCLTSMLKPVACVFQGSQLPSEAYLLSAPISFPLNTLATLLTLLATAAQLKLPVHELVASFASLTGHSQGQLRLQPHSYIATASLCNALLAGILVAGFLSAVTSSADFKQRFKDVLLVSFWTGLRSQQVGSLHECFSAILTVLIR